ncbi:LysR family transcriptional regulator [Rhodococcus sp. USK13]|uniref:LysR family transcriptional regulator n=1 Tax=Rhodococcus sp. USK13 TaxID=2806442 RepID=UPI001BCBD2DF|nr:LysR family transcriptional regulator [Rhodococcus sp. USK13]
MPSTCDYTLTQFRCFVAVAESLHFGAAAATLGIKQPSLSRTLSALEAAVGTPLLHRTSRRVTLTEQGSELLFHAKRAVAAADRFLAAARGVGEAPTSFRLGLSPTVAARMVHDVLPTLRAQIPDVQLRIVEDHPPCMLRQLRAGELDALIGSVPPGIGPGLVAAPLYREDYRLIVSRDDPLRAYTHLSPSTLQNRVTVRVDDDPNPGGKATSPTTPTSRAITVHTAIAWVIGGCGVAVVPESALHPNPLPPAVVAIRFTAETPTRTVGTIYGSPAGHNAPFAPILDRVAEQCQWQSASPR